MLEILHVLQNREIHSQFIGNNFGRWKWTALECWVVEERWNQWKIKFENWMVITNHWWQWVKFRFVKTEDLVQ
jgi:hypothetical protein